MFALRTFLAAGGATAVTLCAILAGATARDMTTPDLSLHGAIAPGERYTVLDRSGRRLGVSYQTRFNLADARDLHEAPEFLRRAIVTAEDRRFFDHGGVDWRARLSALWQNLRAGKIVRGASTITEQVVRIAHPRPRTLWSHWIEGCEAMRLEGATSKGAILAFYLNQAPYAANRRGVAQAARYYFNRDLQTLTEKEMLALAVLPRAPSALDPYRNPGALEPAIARLAAAMEARREIAAGEARQLASQPLVLEFPSPPLNATHFLAYVRKTAPDRAGANGALQTSLDGALQQQAQTLLDERVKALRPKKVHNGAVLVADHVTGEILAWVVAGDPSDGQASGGAIDAVVTPRQPGSALKPFLYALALDMGWSPATQLNDAPMAEAIGVGLHNFHNYSHSFYGKLSLREALGNSLNIPALKTIGFVTPARYLAKLRALGFASLTRPADFYNDGLALGNGEVTLLEMVQGYSALANRGAFRPLTPLLRSSVDQLRRQVFSDEASSLIANILSDPYARRREFGAGSVLNLPTQTAVKTGTSTDYRDAWVIGFNARYTVGVWLGNLGQTPMDGVTGSTGPALVLRGVFALLEQRQAPQPLYLSPRLTQKEVCDAEDAKGENCFLRSEYFAPDPDKAPPGGAPQTSGFDLARPSEGLQIAYDPRIPGDAQAFEFVATGASPGSEVNWTLNGKPIATGGDGRLLWPVSRGSYVVLAQEISKSGAVVSSKSAHFSVK